MSKHNSRIMFVQFINNSYIHILYIFSQHRLIDFTMNEPWVLIRTVNLISSAM